MQSDPYRSSPSYPSNPPHQPNPSHPSRPSPPPNPSYPSHPSCPPNAPYPANPPAPPRPPSPPYRPQSAPPHPPPSPSPRPPRSASPYPPPSSSPYPPQRPSQPAPTYPWQPAAPPEPVHRRRPIHAPLGHHSDLRILRSAYRRQRRVATLTALGYFVLFLILSAFAPGFMTGDGLGGLPVGVLLALAQLPVTWLAIGLYECTARRRVDPLADRIRLQARLDAKRGAAR